MTRLRLSLATLLLVGGAQFIGATAADAGDDLYAQIARLQALVEDLSAHIDPTIVGVTTLTTGMLSPGSDTLACSVVNVSGGELTVGIAAFDSTGRLVKESLETLRPGVGTAMVPDQADWQNNLGYCRFSYSGAPKDVRAHVAQTASDGEPSGFGTALEAR